MKKIAKLASLLHYSIKSVKSSDLFLQDESAADDLEMRPMRGVQ